MDFIFGKPTLSCLPFRFLSLFMNIKLLFLIIKAIYSKCNGQENLYNLNDIKYFLGHNTCA